MDGTRIIARAVHRSHVEWPDTDAAGHHHNTAITRYVEAAEAALLRERGITGYFGAAPRVHYEVNYTDPLWFGQETTTILTVEHIGTSSMRYHFEVWGETTPNIPTRRLAASGRYTVVHVPAEGPHRQERASAPWPKDWITALTTGPKRPSALPTHLRSR
ncbi:acyl-CoA thioesterase [Streptomyces sp. NPDC001661]